MEASEFQKTWFDVVDMGRQHALLHQFAEDAPLNGRHVQLGGQQVLSFASCSYLGLEMDERLRAGAHRAIDRYGTQFSASRAYLSAPPYRELEAKLEKVFGAFVLPVTTTTLGHFSALPVLCGEKDAVLMDQRVHHSVQMATTHVRAQGSKVSSIPHADGVALEQAISTLAPLHRKVWFLIDGVYSMHGDVPDVNELRRLLDTYPTLHLYVDDAHGMSVAGENGRGVHLSRMGWHPRMVLATSLNKAFASAGGVLVFPDAKLRDHVRICGGPYTFGGPVQPPMLGAAIASADIHLSPDIGRFQTELAQRITHFNNELMANGVPLLEANDTPIFFVKCGPVRMAYRLAERLREAGFFITIATYPAVALKRSGLRLSITRNHTMADLSSVAQAIAHHYPKALVESELTREEVERIFSYQTAVAEKQHAAKVGRIFGSVPKATSTKASAPKPNVAATSLTLTYARHIADVDPQLWDGLVGHRSSFNHISLAALERIFSNRSEPESNWGFHYFIVEDEQGQPVAATFFTDALWKDDMLARGEVSERIEVMRRDQPYLLTSRALAMGSLLTEGNHLYLDRQGPWQQALSMLLERASVLMREVGAGSLVVRDLPADDAEVDRVLLESGLVKVPMLDSHIADLTGWADEKEFLQTLGSRTRRRVRTEVIDAQSHFSIKTYRRDGEGLTLGPAEAHHFYELYRRVKARKHRLNTFDLPSDLFSRLFETQGWHIVALHLDPAAGGPADGSAVAVGACCLNGDLMVAVIAGLDGVEREVSVYRQLLWQILLYAKSCGASRLELGMDAEREKTRMGATPRPQCAYVQLTNHDSVEIIAQLTEAVSLGEVTPDVVLPTQPVGSDIKESSLKRSVTS